MTSTRNEKITMKLYMVEENLPFFVSYTQSFLDFGRESSEFLKFPVSGGLVSYKPVSYKKKCISAYLSFERLL